MRADIAHIIAFALFFVQAVVFVGLYVCARHEEAEWRKAVEKRRKEAAKP